MPSFDIVSKVPWHEVDNALQQAQKEVLQRYDFKDTDTEIEKNEDGILVVSSSEDRARAAVLVVLEKLVKRKVSPKFVEQQLPEKTNKGGSKILLEIKEGIEHEPGKKIAQAIKDSKIKVSSSLQDEQVRVTGKNRDDLQLAMQLIRGLDLELELQFINFRD